MRIAIFSDTHGKWKSMYERALDHKCDIILHCGDIETLISKDDLPYFPAPSFFKKQYLNDEKPFEFAEYWSKKEVPLPTYFIAGNHENWLILYRYIQGPVQLIKNLFYFGNYGIVEINGIIIAGFSKIYHPEYSYLMELNENGKEIPYRWSPERKRDNSPKNASYFHLEDLFSLIELAKEYGKIDILLLHENPVGKFPDGFKRHGTAEYFGCKEINELIEGLNPEYVFCGHMHFKDERKIDNSKIVNIEDNGMYLLEI